MRPDRFPSSYNKYIDVIAKGDAYYIVEIKLAAKFEIARLTTNYMMLLHVLLVVFVDSRDLLEHIMKLMYVAIAESSKAWACTYYVTATVEAERVCASKMVKLLWEDRRQCAHRGGCRLGCGRGSKGATVSC